MQKFGVVQFFFIIIKKSCAHQICIYLIKQQQKKIFRNIIII